MMIECFFNKVGMGVVRCKTSKHYPDPWRLFLCQCKNVTQAFTVKTISHFFLYFLFKALITQLINATSPTKAIPSANGLSSDFDKLASSFGRYCLPVRSQFGTQIPLKNSLKASKYLY